jgi:hypothetical protein
MYNDTICPLHVISIIHTGPKVANTEARNMSQTVTEVVLPARRNVVCVQSYTFCTALQLVVSHLYIQLFT